MKILKYRYRPIHAISEKFFELLAPLVSSVNAGQLRETPKKVLVLKFGGMGEAVLARSLVELLRDRHQEMSFDFLVEQRTLETMTGGDSGTVLMYSPGTDGMAKALSTLRQIRNAHYDAILDFEQDSLLTAAFTRATCIPVRVGFIPSKPSVRSRMFTHPLQLHESESMWKSFVRMGQVLDPDLPEHLMTVPLPISVACEDWLHEWWNRHVDVYSGGPVIAMHIGVGPTSQYRRWPAERFVDLATAMANIRQDLIIILTGAKSEQPLIAEFRENFSGTSVDASNLGKLEHTVAVLKRCKLLISNDTGIMHLAAAQGIPTVGLFGASNPIWWNPIGPKATYVYTTHQPCSPCINSYQRIIPERCVASQESACMWDIRVEDVMNAARTVIDGSWLS